LFGVSRDIPACESSAPTKYVANFTAATDALDSRSSENAGHK